MGSIRQFAKKKYINIETFRKNGEGVKTPVWFAEADGLLFVITGADSGKVKRIRRNAIVNITPCTMGGKPLDAWAPAEARELTAPTDFKRIDQLFDRKYGLMKKMFESQRNKNDTPDTVLEIKLKDQAKLN